MQLTVISGASSGIGKALAAKSERLGHTVATISRRPGPGTFLEADLSDPGSWHRVGEWIDDLVRSQAWDRVVFIHNAGVIEPVGFAGEVDQNAYTSSILLNGAAPVVLGSAFIASVGAARLPAHLLLISSGAGRRAIRGWSSYCAGKAATDMWAQAAGMEQDFRQSGITVTSVAPGVVDTDMQSTIRQQDADAFPDIDNFHALKASGSLLSPETVAEMLLEIAATDSGGSAGAMAISNGGLLHVGDYAPK